MSSEPGRKRMERLMPVPSARQGNLKPTTAACAAFSTAAIALLLAACSAVSAGTQPTAAVPPAGAEPQSPAVHRRRH